MTSRSVCSTLVLLILLVPAAVAGTDQVTGSSAPGVYLLVEVNGEAPPSVSGTKTSEGRICESEALAGAILLGSDGGMAALVTEREICTDPDGSQTTSGEKSEIFFGSYELSSETLILHWETPDLGDDEVSLTDGVLVITDVGEFDYEGQTTEWVLQKAD